MDAMQYKISIPAGSIIGPHDPVLITGANGFIGSRVVNALLNCGFRELRCLVRPSSDLRALKTVLAGHGTVSVRIVEGNLLSPATANGSQAMLRSFCTLLQAVE